MQMTQTSIKTTDGTIGTGSGSVTKSVSFDPEITKAILTSSELNPSRTRIQIT